MAELKPSQKVWADEKIGRLHGFKSKTQNDLLVVAVVVSYEAGDPASGVWLQSGRKDLFPSYVKFPERVQ
jgi:hypothetical protein